MRTCTAWWSLSRCRPSCSDLAEFASGQDKRRRAGCPAAIVVSVRRWQIAESTLYLIHTVPAWAARITAREVKQPTVFVIDTGLAAALLGVTPEAVAPTRPNSPAGGFARGGRGG